MCTLPRGQCGKTDQEVRSERSHDTSSNPPREIVSVANGLEVRFLVYVEEVPGQFPLGAQYFSLIFYVCFDLHFGTNPPR